MSTELFEAKPRWKGAPPICIAANLMAFKTRSDLDEYRSSIGMEAYGFVKQPWKCEKCNHLHYVGKVPNPAGDSSGTGRSSK